MKTLLGITFILCAAAAIAQSCPDVADESHHELLFENKQARIFRLDLPRLASSDFHCHPYAYFRIAATDSRTSESTGSDVSIVREWYAGATRWVLPVRHRVRNDGLRPHREYIVETKHGSPYNPLDGNYDTDVFPDPANSQPSWTLTENRGALIARKVQLAAGAAVDVPPPDFLLIALNDIVLSDGKADTEPVRISKGDYKLLDGSKTRTLRNASSSPALFITVEF